MSPTQDNNPFSKQWLEANRMLYLLVTKAKSYPIRNAALAVPCHAIL